MALYIPAGRRKRRLLLAGGAGLLIGLLLGFGVGRTSAPNPEDQAKSAKQTAGRVTGALNALPFHYEQAMNGEIDKTTYATSLDAALRTADDDLVAALANAPWLDPSAKVEVRAQIPELRALAERGASPDEFDAAVGRAVSTIEAAFGTFGAAGPAGSRPGTTTAR
jgi:hypothetical protein